jgi:predicted house-cleaning noncanonical NTP pyrophosphatase (MazG superfamily)
VKVIFEPAEEMKELVEIISHLNHANGFTSHNATELADVRNILKDIRKAMRRNNELSVD